MPNETFDLTEMYGQYANKDAAKEANAFRTVPTGRYTFTPTELQGQLASEKSKWPGRRMLHFAGNLTARVDGAEVKKGKHFFDTSMAVVRTATGRLDGPSQLFGNHLKALGLTAEQPFEELRAAMETYPVDVLIEENAIEPTADGGRIYHKIATDEARAAATAQGWDLTNFTRSVAAVKDAG